MIGVTRVVLTMELPVFCFCPSSDLSCFCVVVWCSECTLNETFIRLWAHITKENFTKTLLCYGFFFDEHLKSLFATWKPVFFTYRYGDGRQRHES